MYLVKRGNTLIHVKFRKQLPDMHRSMFSSHAFSNGGFVTTANSTPFTLGETNVRRRREGEAMTTQEIHEEAIYKVTFTSLSDQFEEFHAYQSVGETEEELLERVNQILEMVGPTHNQGSLYGLSREEGMPVD